VNLKTCDSPKEATSVGLLVAVVGAPESVGGKREKPSSGEEGSFCYGNRLGYGWFMERSSMRKPSVRNPASNQRRIRLMRGA
jgi:hypothetical protein